MNCPNRNIRVQLLQATASILVQHQTMVGALEKPRPELLAEWGAKDYKVALLHGGYGIGGETGEIVEALLENDIKGLIKELGDATFYGQLVLVAVRQASEVEGFTMNMESEGVSFDPYGFQPIRDLQILQSKAMDSIKKVALYGQPMSGDTERPVQHHVTITNTIREFMFGLVLVGEMYGFSADDILEGNIEKLAVRYAEGGYSDAAAASRRDELTGAALDLREALDGPVDGPGPLAGFAPTIVEDEPEEDEIIKQGRLEKEKRQALFGELRALSPAERIDRLRHCKDSELLFDVRTGLFINAVEVFGTDFGPIVRDEVIERWQSELPEGVLPDGTSRKADIDLGELDPAACNTGKGEEPCDSCQ